MRNRPLRRLRRRAGGSLGLASLALLAITVVGAAAAVVLLAGGKLPSAADDAPVVAVRSAPPLERSAYASAVYLMPLNRAAPDPIEVMRATGQETFQLTFILALGGRCEAAWDGTRSLARDGQIAATVDAVRAAGGDVSVAFGGGRGTKLGEVCSDAAATAAAYQTVIDRYRLRAIDFDIEDPEWRNDDAVARELGAAQMLERDNPGLYVSVTLPAVPDHVAARALAVLATAKAIGYTPDNFSIMPFDFHGSDPMGPRAIDAIEVMHEQLMATFGWDTWDAYRHEGVSLMNGRTDHGEHFLQADFEAVLRYAIDHRLGRFTFWALNRDRACDPLDNNGKTSGACSSVPQAAWDFTRFTARFAVAAAPRPTPARTAATASSSR